MRFSRSYAFIGIALACLLILGLYVHCRIIAVAPAAADFQREEKQATR